MRLNHVFNNQNGNTNLNDNFDSIGYSTSPNFGNYINLNLTNNQNMEKRNRDFGQSSEENLLNSVSIFNKGGKRINAVAKRCPYCHNTSFFNYHETKQIQDTQKNSSKWKKCPRCSKKINKVAKKCPYCGYKY